MLLSSFFARNTVIGSCLLATIVVLPCHSCILVTNVTVVTLAMLVYYAIYDNVTNETVVTIVTLVYSDLCCDIRDCD